MLAPGQHKSMLPVLQVHLDPQAMVLSWRYRGGRWKGRCRSMGELVHETDKAGVPDHCVIDFVEART